MTLIYDLDLVVSSSNIEIAVSQKRQGQLTWSERDVSRSIFWTHYMVLNFDFDLTHDFDLEFLRSNFEMAICQDWVS